MSDPKPAEPQALEEKETFLPAGGHTFGDEECPTFYDGCHCTVEALVHNIKRADKAEQRFAELQKSLQKLFNAYLYNLINFAESEPDAWEEFKYDNAELIERFRAALAKPKETR